MSKLLYCQLFFDKGSVVTNNKIKLNTINIELSENSECRDFLKRKSGIYFWLSLIDNRIYIGSAVCLWNRLLSYLGIFNRRQVRNNFPLVNSVKKHGIENFKFGILEILNDNRIALKNREQELLDYVKPFGENGFNISKSAFRALNCEISKEGRQRIRERHTGEMSEMSKLTNLKVLDIKTRLSKGELLKNLSKEFGVSTTVISNIKRGKTWSHIKVDDNIQEILDRKVQEEKHKYTEDFVKKIKKDIKDGIRMIDISKKYSIPYMTINGIKRGDTHASVVMN